VNARTPISIEQVATAARKVHAMSMAEKVALTEEIHARQPNLLASCLVQPRLGVAIEKVEFLLNILLVCFQAMKEAGGIWPLITEDEQGRHLSRHIGAVRFSEELADPALADAARDQYLAGHSEAPLLAFVIGECNAWLADLARRNVESESDKFVMMPAVKLVNCIAAAERKERG
jgi:hypothetical protein